jgi:hypothetical protein
VARGIIDKIFDLELKKETLLKAVLKYQVNVEERLIQAID